MTSFHGQNSSYRHAKSLEKEGLEMTTEVRAYDVVCGRSREGKDHFGNKFYRFSIMMQRPIYAALSSNVSQEREKNMLAAGILDSIRSQGGRFLERSHIPDKWCIMPEDWIMKKLKQSLRENQPAMLKFIQEKYGSDGHNVMEGAIQLVERMKGSLELVSENPSAGGLTKSARGRKAGHKKRKTKHQQQNTLQLKPMFCKKQENAPHDNTLATAGTTSNNVSSSNNKHDSFEKVGLKRKRPSFVASNQSPQQGCSLKNPHRPFVPDAANQGGQSCQQYQPDRAFRELLEEEHPDLSPRKCSLVVDLAQTCYQHAFPIVAVGAQPPSTPSLVSGPPILTKTAMMKKEAYPSPSISSRDAVHPEVTPSYSPFLALPSLTDGCAPSTHGGLAFFEEDGILDAAAPLATAELVEGNECYDALFVGCAVDDGESDNDNDESDSEPQNKTAEHEQVIDDLVLVGIGSEADPSVALLHDDDGATSSFDSLYDDDHSPLPHPNGCVGPGSLQDCGFED